MAFPLALLHLTLTRYNGQGRSHAHLDCKHFLDGEV